MTRTRRKRKKRRNSHLHRRHPLPAHFVSGIVYVTAAIACISLGALLYKEVKKAGHDLKKETARSSIRSSSLPPNATVVGRRKKGGSQIHYQKERNKPTPRKKKQPAAPIPIVSSIIPTPIEPVEIIPAISAPPPNPRPTIRPLRDSLPRTLLEPQSVTVSPSADTTLFGPLSSQQEGNGGGLETLILKGN